MPVYTKLKLKAPLRTPAQMRGLMKSAAAKGVRIIDGQKFVLRGSVPTKKQARKAAKQYRESHYTRIIKSKHYGDYELWMRRR